jgi:hypothetical protein
MNTHKTKIIEIRNRYIFSRRVFVMAEIIRGTTPTIKFVFNTIEVASITTAYFLIKNGQKIII